MIFTVSTAKDSAENLREFRRRNLAAGVDHVLVFLDGPDAAVEESLRDDPYTTTVVTDDAYWKGSRPRSLNDRQLVNANLANAALAGLDDVDWLFHIDADEALQIDRERLLADVGREVEVVRVRPLEAVSQPHWDGEVTHFKPLLSREQIDELVRRGLVRAPEPDEHPNATWFSGHVKGKLGVRPDLGIRLELHEAYAGSGQALPALERPWLEHLHYESHSGEEFVRKWLAHLDAGPIRLRPRRKRLMAQIAAIVEDPALEESGRAAAFAALYEREVADDLPALDAAGVLVRPRPGSSVPTPLSPEQATRLDAVLGALAGADKAAFHPRQEPTPIELVAELARDHDDPAHPALAAALARAADRAAVRAEAEDAAPSRGRTAPGRLRRALGRFR